MALVHVKKKFFSKGSVRENHFCRNESTRRLEKDELPLLRA